MAFIRWKAMRTAQSIFMKKPKIVWYTFFGIASTVCILCVPTYLVHDVKPIRLRSGSGDILEILDFYTVDISVFALQNKCKLFKANLWIIGICLKVSERHRWGDFTLRRSAFQAVPCFLLLWFTLALMMRLHQNNVKRAMLLYSKSNKGARKRKQNYDRTTFTLIVVLTVFLV